MSVAPTLPVSEVVNVTIEMSPVAAALRNFGAMLVLGTSDVIDTDERLRTYSGVEGIAADFGTDAPEYQAAVTFFGQSPQPSQLVVGRWAKTATAGLLRGRMLAISQQQIADFEKITSGSFTVEIDGSSVSVASVDLSSQSNLNGVATQITTALASKGTCVFDGTRFIIKSATTGVNSSVANVSSTELSKVMGLDAGTTKVNGAEAENLVDAVTACLDYTNWYGLYVCGTDWTDADALEVSALINAARPSRIVSWTSQNTGEMDSTNSTSLGSKLKALGYNRTICTFSSTSDTAGVSVLGRMSTINFEGSNTTITLKFKQLPGVVAENLRTSQSLALRNKNVNVFAAFQNDTSIYKEGVTSGGWFIDETHGLDWQQNRVETDLWNLLYTTTTKIGQDEAGMTAILATINKSLDAGVRNGLIAPGGTAILLVLSRRATRSPQDITSTFSRWKNRRRAIARPVRHLRSKWLSNCAAQFTLLTPRSRSIDKEKQDGNLFLYGCHCDIRRADRRDRSRIRFRALQRRHFRRVQSAPE